MTAFMFVGRTAADADFAIARRALDLRGHAAAAGERPDVVIGELGAGERSIPPAIIALARAHSARVMLWTKETLVRPLVALGANVVVVAPGQRAHVLAGLDLLIGSSGPLTNTLGRMWWAGWTIGHAQAGLQLVCNDRDGVTFVGNHDDPGAAATATAILRDAHTDNRRESRLHEELGEGALVVHLPAVADHWLVYWSGSHPLWLASAMRMPSRWCLSAALAVSNARLARLPAFSGDTLVAAKVSEESTTKVFDQLALGPLDVHAALRSAVEDERDWGFVVEAR
ncbi:MAG: hypothetical protein ACKV2T_09155 [Kofleriaceae bacterium]